MDGLEGDDHFYILSTNPDLVTTIIGGLGSDTFDVGGDVTRDVVALSVEGTSGFINHSVSSADEAYNGIYVEGVPLNVANAQTGGLIVSRKDMTLVEGGLSGPAQGTYTVKLAAPAPGDGSVTYVTISAALDSFKNALAGGQSVEISTDGTNFFNSLVLAFDSTKSGANAAAWDRQQTIYVRAKQDTVSEGEQTIILSTSTQSTNATFNGLKVANVEVKLIDDDLAGLVLTETQPGKAVIEGDATGITYSVGLTQAPKAGESVYVHLDLKTARLIAAAANASQAGQFDPATNTITFTAGNWLTPFVVRVTGAEDSLVENPLDTSIVHTITSSDTLAGNYRNVTVQPEQKLHLLDNDIGSVIVTQTNGGTLVSDNQSDTYTLQLAKAPSALVHVSLLSDGKTLLSGFNAADTRFHAAVGNAAPYVEFSAADWNVPLVVKVDANPAVVPPVGQPIQEFVAQPHTTGSIAGPLYIEGGIIPNKARALRTPVTLPSEEHSAGAVGNNDPNAPQLDVLRVFNDGSFSNDTGTLDFAKSTSGLASIYSLTDAQVAARLAEWGNISGLNMGAGLTLNLGPGLQPAFDGGITYRGLSIVDVLLGAGNDTFTVQNTVAGSITAIQGGGNSLVNGLIGGDHIIINGGGGNNAPLIVYGDTAQDGAEYAGNLGKSALARPFVRAGNDIIDARGATQSVVIYGGAGNDLIYGGAGDDQLAGGSGNDEIHGGAGNDHIYGDDGFNVDLTQRVLTVANSNASLAPNSDGLLAGNDNLFGDAGLDIILGDHGIITQGAGTARLFSTSNVVRVESVLPNDGGDDVIDGGTGTLISIGGLGGDHITGDDQMDVLIGDLGFTNVQVTSGSLLDVSQVQSTDAGLGGDDVLDAKKWG